MILSMTGFGDAQLEEDGQAYRLEMRSVNNRYLKADIHLPEDFAFLEIELEKFLRQRVTRGTISVRLYVRNLSAAAAQELNAAAIRQYMAYLQPLLADAPRLTLDVAMLATLPGVCQPRELTERQREHCWEIVSRLTNAALEKLLAMRLAEGQTLADDLRKHCEQIGALLESVGQRVPQVVREYRDRLTARVAELIAGQNVRLAEQDLLKEVAIYAERSDISEEISRLRAHLDQFHACLRSREPAGRKLEFISQEMLREANTMGSKSGDAQLARDIIDIKSAIDRIKEQVQNAE